MKSAQVHKLRAQTAVEAWMQQQYTAQYQQTAYYSPSPQSKTPEAAFHHMQTVQVNSLTKQEDKRHIWPPWLTAQLDAQVHQFDCEVDTGAGCNVMSLYIYRSLFEDKKPEPSTFSINGHGDFPVKSRVMHSCTPHWVSGITENSIPGHRHKMIPHPWP